MTSPKTWVSQTKHNSDLAATLASANTAAQQTVSDAVGAETNRAQTAETTLTALANSKYTVPSGGIPNTDLAVPPAAAADLATLQQSLGTASTYDAATFALANDLVATNQAVAGKYAKPSGGIPDSDLTNTPAHLTDFQALTSTVAQKYVKPSSGIPDADLANTPAHQSDLTALTTTVNGNSSNITALTSTVNTNSGAIGTLTSLKTSAKGSLVAAINEVSALAANASNFTAVDNADGTITFSGPSVADNGDGTFTVTF